MKKIFILCICIYLIGLLFNSNMPIREYVIEYNNDKVIIVEDYYFIGTVNCINADGEVLCGNFSVTSKVKYEGNINYLWFMP